MKHHDLDFLQSELSRVSEWVQFADKKAGFIAIFYSAMFVFLIGRGDDVFCNIFAYEGVNWLYAFSFLVLLGFISIGTYYLFITVFPRLKNSNTNRSLFYFGTVANMKIEDYLEDIERLTEEDARHQIAEQIYTNSVIAYLKMKNMKMSTYSLICAGIFMFILFFP